MRSSLLLTSVLVANVLARPQVYRRQPKVVYETEVVVHTVVVTLTQDHLPPTSTSLALPSTSNLSASPPSKPGPEPQPQPSPSPMILEVHPTPFASAEPESDQDPSARPTAPADAHMPGTDQAYLSAGPEYQAAVLFHHNAVRANHDAAPLSWDSGCEANARIAASRCDFEHFIPKHSGQGQNLFTVSGNAFNITAGITESWYRGELAPMAPWFGKPSLPHEVFEKVGHLTQLVWKATNKVGCASLDCGAAMTVGGRPSKMNKYTVCNYAPAGNAGGKYAANVVPPTSSTNHIGWAD
ncbi:scp-like extracellular protein [Stemphylium lycopersici]|nr:scp-like extracellular protein [Stemphylium lycopersici]